MRPKNRVTEFQLTQTLTRLLKPAKGHEVPSPTALRNAAIIELLAYGGLMPAEVARLLCASLRADESTIVVYGSDGRMHATIREVTIPSGSAVWQLPRLPSDGPAIRTFRGKPLSARQINNIVRDAFRGRVNPMALRAYYRENHEENHEPAT